MAEETKTFGGPQNRKRTGVSADEYLAPAPKATRSEDRATPDQRLPTSRIEASIGRGVAKGRGASTRRFRKATIPDPTTQGP